MKEKNIVPQIKKVFQVKLGLFADGSQKDVEYYEDENFQAITVLAYDVFDALALVGEWILEQEKIAKKDHEGVFVHSVENITDVDVVKL